jgi:hypothetical protein
VANGHGGKRENAGAKKGQPKSKATALLREAIVIAAEKAGRKIDADSEDGLVTYLENQAEKSPSAFLSLLGKVLPMQLGGDPDNPVRQVVRIELVGADG